jgi:outer membrane protein TolC
VTFRLRGAMARVLRGAFVRFALTVGAPVLGAVTVMCAHPDVAHAEDTLTMQAVLTSMERTYPLLRAAEVEKLIADADTLSAEGGFDLSWKTRASMLPIAYYDYIRVESMLEKPTAIWGATAFAGYRLGTGKFPVYYGYMETLEFGEVRVGLNVPLWRNGPIDRRRANLRRAELGQDVARLTVQQQRIELSRAAAQRYWAWVAAGRRLQIANDLLKIATDRDGGLLERATRGDIAMIERTDNLRAMEQRRAQVALAQRGLEQATLELALFYRDEQGKRLEARPDQLPKSFPELTDRSPNLQSDIRMALERRPEAKRLALQSAREEVEKRFADNQRALGVDLQVAGSQDFGRANPLRPDLSKPVLEASLMLDVPLQTRLMEGRSDAASANMRRIAEQKRFAEDRIETDVRDAHSALRAATERVRATRREVKLAEELEESERVKFQQGDSHLLIVNIREQQTAEAELREVDATLDFFRAEADLRAARGE